MLEPSQCFCKNGVTVELRNGKSWFRQASSWNQEMVKGRRNPLHSGLVAICFQPSCPSHGARCLVDAGFLQPGRGSEQGSQKPSKEGAPRAPNKGVRKSGSVSRDFWLDLWERPGGQGPWECNGEFAPQMMRLGSPGAEREPNTSFQVAQPKRLKTKARIHAGH